MNLYTPPTQSTSETIFNFPKIRDRNTYVLDSNAVGMPINIVTALTIKEIFNCCCDGADRHQTTIDHVKFNEQQRLLVVSFSNWEEHPKPIGAINASFMEVHRKLEGEVFQLQVIYMSKQFIRSLKWDVGDFSLQCMLRGMPNIFGKTTNEQILKEEMHTITSSPIQDKKFFEGLLECEDGARRVAKLQIFSRIMGNRLITRISIEQMVSEERLEKKENKGVLNIQKQKLIQLLTG